MKRLEIVLSVVGIILTLVALLFGDNLYQQVTGRSIGDDVRNFFAPATEAPIEILPATPSDVAQPTSTPIANLPVVVSPTTILPTATPAKSVISYGQLLYEENFDNTKGWDLAGNRLENGLLIMGAGVDAVPFSGSTKPSTFSDFIFESRFLYPASSDGVEFMVRQQYPPCSDWNCSIVVVIDRPYNIYAYRWENAKHGAPIASASANLQQLELQPDQWNRITIIAQGSEYTVYINDYFVMRFTDDKYLSGTFILNNPGPSEVMIDYVRFMVYRRRSIVISKTAPNKACT